MRKKAGVAAEIDNLDNGLGIVKLLAKEEFDKETGGYESELEEDEHEESLDALDLEATPVVDKVSKKRKASNSKKLQGSKYVSESRNMFCSVTYMQLHRRILVNFAWICKSHLLLLCYRRKKSKLASAKESLGLEDVENDVHVVKSGNSHRLHKKNRVKKEKSSDVQGEPEKSSSPEIDETTNCIMRKAKR